MNYFYDSHLIYPANNDVRNFHTFPRKFINQMNSRHVLYLITETVKNNHPDSLEYHSFSKIYLQSLEGYLNSNHKKSCSLQIVFIFSLFLK